MKPQNKETVFLLVVSTMLAIVISRAYADPVEFVVPQVQAQQSQPR